MPSTVAKVSQVCKILEGQAANWTSEDWDTIFKPLEQQGYKWDPFDLRMRQIGPKAVTIDTPWCHAKSLPSKQCTLDHQVIFNNFGIIHPRCMECWKVTCGPKNFDELMKLEQLQLQMNVSCKCGAELRDYVPKHWGGYWYTNSLDEGRERHKQVKEAVAEVLSPETAETVILKRGCTEIEFLAGPSPYWSNTREQEEFLDIIESKIDAPNGQGEQYQMAKTKVHLKWLAWAHENGDMSYLPYNNNKALYPDYVKYHEHDIDDLKRDLAIARGQAKGEINPEVSSDFLILANQFAQDHDVHLGDLGHTLGANFSNPLNLTKVNQREPNGNEGEHDELT